MAADARAVLMRARELIETKGWTQGVYARDSRGRETPTADPDTCAFCLLGALIRANNETGFRRLDRVSPLVLSELGTQTIAEWNDAPGRTRDEVLAALDRAIQRQNPQGVQ